MAHWAWDEGKAPTGLARLGMLYPLEKYVDTFNVDYISDIKDRLIETCTCTAKMKAGIPSLLEILIFQNTRIILS